MIQSRLPKQKLMVKCPLVGDKKSWMKAFDDALTSQKVGSTQVKYRNGLQCSSVHISETTSTPTSSEKSVKLISSSPSREIKVNRQCSILEGLKHENQSDDFFDNVLDDFDKILAKYS